MNSEHTLSIPSKAVGQNLQKSLAKPQDWVVWGWKSRKKFFAEVRRRNVYVECGPNGGRSIGKHDYCVKHM
jgi:hypothetical protein